jgi:hypothetical protein
LIKRVVISSEIPKLRFGMPFAKEIYFFSFEISYTFYWPLANKKKLALYRGPTPLILLLALLVEELELIFYEVENATIFSNLQRNL